MASKRTTIAILHNLGLTTNEAKCYLAALALGEAPVQAVAKSADVNRSNAYAAVRGLIERGLLHESIKAKTKLIQAAPVESLRDFARARQKQATKLRWKVEDLVPALSGLLAQLPEHTRFTALEGPDALIQILRRSTQNIKPGTEILELCFMREDGTRRTEQFSEEEYIPARVQQRCPKRMICTDHPIHRGLIPRDKKELRQTRFLAERHLAGVEMCNVIICPSEITIYWESPKPHGIIIQSTKIANLLRMLFNIAWEQTPPP